MPVSSSFLSRDRPRDAAPTVTAVTEDALRREVVALQDELRVCEAQGKEARVKAIRTEIAWRRRRLGGIRGKAGVETTAVDPGEKR